MRPWAPSWTKRNVLLFSDNAAVVATLQSGRAHEPFLRAAARETWLWAALYDIHLVVRHRPGASTVMRAADALSRAHLNTHFMSVVNELEATGSKRVAVPLPLLAEPLTGL